MRFKNRAEAGGLLAERLLVYREGAEVLVLGLPRGGVAVAAPVAERLDAPLDVFVVRKVGVPGHEELAMGAVASGGVVVRNREVLAALQISDDIFRQAADVQHQEVIRREQLYRGQRPRVALRGKTVILIDDGLATGASMRAAVEAIRHDKPRRLVVAVPVAAWTVADQFRALVGDFVCLHEPEDLDGVSRWYQDFRQATDEEVGRLLDAAAARRPLERIKDEG